MDSQKHSIQSRGYESNTNVRSSQIFYNIADEDMSQFFMDYIEQAAEKDEIQKEQQDCYQQNLRAKQQKLQSYDTKLQQRKEVISRLDLEIEKHRLIFTPVYGELFIMFVNAQLIGQQKKQQGNLLLTNYRMAFFKHRNRKLDLPFGFIGQSKLNDRLQQITAQLKYNHFWKMRIIDEKCFSQIKIFLQIYSKVDSIKSCFAFSYAAKFPDISKFKHPQTINQFVRLGFLEYKTVHAIENSDFTICKTYPQLFYIPTQVSHNHAQRISKYWISNRIPTLTYIHSSNSKFLGTIWRSSAIMCQNDKPQIQQQIKTYLKLIRNKCNMLYVFDSGSKNNRKGVQQIEFDSQCQMKYLQVFSLSNIKSSYLSILQCFLNPKKTFIKDLISSKWYQGVLQFLKGANQISNRLFSQNNVLIKCDLGVDRSAVLSALTQIIINPYYRTYNGFATLVQKQFQYFGHPFRSRLGFTSEKDEQIPIFIMFLDCVCQLIFTNEMSFQYNFKYLSKLSNLMYPCCFGTFISNCRLQVLQNRIQADTVPIWDQLISQLTSNAFYRQKNGILEMPIKFDDIRIWKQHFWYLTTPPKQTYKIHPLAEDNLDYINLNCSKVKTENKNLRDQIDKQRKTIESLKQKIKTKQEQILKNKLQ